VVFICHHGPELSLAGITAKTLAKEFGTPTFFIDEADFRERALAWDKALKDSLDHMLALFITHQRHLFVQNLLAGSMNSVLV